MDHKDLMCEGVDWIHLVQGRDQQWLLVNMVIKLRVS